MFVLAKLGFARQVPAGTIPACVSGKTALPPLGSGTSLRHSHRMPFAAVCHGKGDLVECRSMVCLTQYCDLYLPLDQLCDRSVYDPSFRSPLLTPLKLLLNLIAGVNGHPNLHHHRRGSWNDEGAMSQCETTPWPETCLPVDCLSVSDCSQRAHLNLAASVITLHVTVIQKARIYAAF